MQRRNFIKMTGLGTASLAVKNTVNVSILNPLDNSYEFSGLIVADGQIYLLSEKCYKIFIGSTTNKRYVAKKLFKNVSVLFLWLISVPLLHLCY